MSLVALRGLGSFLPSSVKAAKPEQHGGLLSTLCSSQNRHLTLCCINELTNDFAVCDSHGQVFHFDVENNKYQLVRMASSTPITCMTYLHSKLNYMVVAYEAGNLVVVDYVQRKGVVTMQASNNTPLRMVRCHPMHSILLGYSVSDIKTVDIYDLRKMQVTRTMPVKENVIDMQFLCGGEYIGILFETSGFVVYRARDCSFALQCPFPSSERMPKWTAFTVLQDTLINDDNVPFIRVLTAGDNGIVHLWESPQEDDDDSMIALKEGEYAYCALLALAELPVGVDDVVFMSTLGDQITAPDVYRIHIISSEGNGIIVDIQGLPAPGTDPHSTDHPVGMWTIMSDLSDFSVIGQPCPRVSGIPSDAIKSSTGNDAVVKVKIPSVTGNLDDAMKSYSNLRLDGITVSGGFMYINICTDGFARVFDSDYGVGFGANAGLLLQVRATHSEPMRVPIIRYRQGKAETVLSAPRIEVKQQKGIVHSGSRKATGKDVKVRASASAGHKNAEKIASARSAPILPGKTTAVQDDEPEVKTASGSRGPKISNRSKAILKARKSAKVEAHAKEIEKRAQAEADKKKERKLIAKNKVSAKEEMEIERMRSEREREKENQSSQQDDFHDNIVAIKEYDGHGSQSISELVFEVPPDKRVTESKLKALFKVKGEFPSRHRTLIWRVLLKLPENTDAFSDLVRRGVHASCVDLADKYPLRSRRVFYRLQACLSQLCHWAPLLANSSYLPQIVFPFINVYGNDEVAALETVMTIMMWWGYSWNALYPNPPIHIIDSMDSLIQHLEPRVHNHLMNHLKMAPGIIGWTMLSTLFTEILDKEDWLRMMDFMFLHFNEPGNLLFGPIAIMNVLKNQIVTCHTEHEVNTLLRNQQKFDFAQISKTLSHYVSTTNRRYLSAMAYKTKTSSNLLPDSTGLEANLDEVEEARENIALGGGSPSFPLTKGRYPVYDSKPQVIEDWQMRDRAEAIANNEEIGLVGDENPLESLHHHMEKIDDDHKDFMDRENRFASEETKRRVARTAKERAQLQELERIEKEVNEARNEATRRKENAVKEQMDLLETMTTETKDVIDTTEAAMKDRIGFQMEIAKNREIAEKTETATQSRIESMLHRRTKDEWSLRQSKVVEMKEEELALKEKVFDVQSKLYVDEVNLAAQQREKQGLIMQEEQELGRINEGVISRVQGLLLNRESQLIALESDRSVRLAVEHTQEGAAAADRAKELLYNEEKLRIAQREAKIVELKNVEQIKHYEKILSDVRSDAQVHRDLERKTMMRDMGSRNAEKRREQQVADFQTRASQFQSQLQETLDTTAEAQERAINSTFGMQPSYDVRENPMGVELSKQASDMGYYDNRKGSLIDTTSTIDPSVTHTQPRTVQSMGTESSYSSSSSSYISDSASGTGTGSDSDTKGSYASQGSAGTGNVKVPATIAEEEDDASADVSLDNILAGIGSDVKVKVTHKSAKGDNS